MPINPDPFSHEQDLATWLRKSFSQTLFDSVEGHQTNRFENENALSKATETLHEGGQIGKYTLLSPLGKGGYGLVWTAVDNAYPERKIAIKVISAECADRNCLSKFKAEARALTRLDHPNIITIYDAGTALISGLELPYIAMKHIAGVTLHNWLEQNPPLAERLRILILVCDALAHAHGNSIYHRDVKTNNIMVSQKGGPDDTARPTPYVIDFGIGEIASEQVEKDEALHEDTKSGSSGMNAVSDPANAGRDIRGFGEVICVTLIGARDLNGLNAETFVKKLRASSSGFSTTSLRHLFAILENALSPANDEDERYRTAGDVLRDLQSLAGRHPVSVGKQRISSRMALFYERNRGICRVTAASAAACVAATALAWGSYSAGRTAEKDAEAARSAATTAKENEEWARKLGGLAVFAARNGLSPEEDATYRRLLDKMVKERAGKFDFLSDLEKTVSQVDVGQIFPSQKQASDQSPSAKELYQSLYDRTMKAAGSEFTWGLIEQRAGEIQIKEGQDAKSK